MKNQKAAQLFLKLCAKNPGVALRVPSEVVDEVIHSMLPIKGMKHVPTPPEEQPSKAQTLQFCLEACGFIPKAFQAHQPLGAWCCHVTQDPPEES